MRVFMGRAITRKVLHAFQFFDTKTSVRLDYTYHKFTVVFFCVYRFQQKSEKCVEFIYVKFNSIYTSVPIHTFSFFF